MFRAATDRAGIALVVERPEAPVTAQVDREMWERIVLNLVSNALKFTLQGGRVCVRGERSGDDIHFSVSDTGSGIQEGTFDSVFQRFWQADENHRRGTGLGLYISKSLVEAHKGRIWLESKLGQGSTFHFTIPIVAGA
jgi:signal transduction histidine kinase